MRLCLKVVGKRRMRREAGWVRVCVPEGTGCRVSGWAMVCEMGTQRRASAAARGTVGSNGSPSLGGTGVKETQSGLVSIVWSRDTVVSKASGERGRTPSAGNSRGNQARMIKGGKQKKGRRK